MVLVKLGSPNDSQVTLPIRQPAKHEDAALEMHPVPSRDALIVDIEPPKAPIRKINHVPCDIVLTIDVSGSMMSPAPVPGDDTSEPSGLTVLDLVKHASLAIIETLDEGDRLGIVTFSTDIKVELPLTPMSEENKVTARSKVNDMRVRSSTNLWHGILESIKLFEQAPIGRQTRSIMVLTDGMPNHMCPRNGYGPKLKSLQPLPATIHTFGFGYMLSVGLLKAVAEVGGGNYAFIPDAGMIGTVFVHAVANLQSTFATNAVLELTYPKTMGLENAVGDSADQKLPEEQLGADAGKMKLQVPLGNLQYGQKRSVFLRVKYSGSGAAPISAGLNYHRTSNDGDAIEMLSETGEAYSQLFAHCEALDETRISASEVAYCESRALICEFITGLFDHSTTGERKKPDAPDEAKKQELADLIRTIPAKDHSDPDNMSLMEDLSGDDPKGQVSLAISRSDYFNRWGTLYLPSFHNAHTRQICNSFKDPGPLRYGADSPLFIACRDRLDNAFDMLPPPPPTRVDHRHTHGGGAIKGWNPPGFGNGSALNSSKSRISMASYNRSMGPCFGGSTLVEMSTGTAVEIRRLRRGMKVKTPAGSRKVAAVLRTPVQGQLVTRMARSNVLVTQFHPISVDAKDWVFPADTEGTTLRYTGSIYSVMLQRDSDPTAHAIRLGVDNAIWGVTLGHGITGTPADEGDIRTHEFLGDYDAVGRSLMALGNWRKGVIIGGGVVKDYDTGRVSGFRRPRMMVKPGAPMRLPRIVISKRHL